MSAPENLDSSDTTGGESQSREELVTQIRLLTEENKRLRESYTQAKQTQYRQTALSLTGVGVLASMGAIVVTSASTVLFALAGVGFFGGILTYYITPEQFVSADVGRSVYQVLADNEATLAQELGLTTEQVYIPDGTTDPDVKLFVPQTAGDPLPSPQAVQQCIVVTEGQTKGLAFQPSASRLFHSFKQTLPGSLDSEPATMADQLTEALVEQFELLESASTDFAPDEGRLTVSCVGSAYGPIDRFDHPVKSFLAVGIATGLDTPVSVESVESTDDRTEYYVTCRWEGFDSSDRQ